MLPRKDVQKELENYKSDYIDLHEFDKKLYVDPIYSEELPVSNVLYANISGDWIVDTNTDEYGREILKFIDDKSGQYIEIAFPDAVNRMKFANEVYTKLPVKQEHSGASVSDLINRNALYEEKKSVSDFTKMATITAGVAVASILSAIWIKKKMKSK